MSSGGKGGRSNKASRGGTERNTGGSSTHNHSKSDHNHNDREKDGLLHKIAPTAEQLRIAQMIDNSHSEPEKVLHEKINQVMQVTGVSTDDAIVALHDCDNDVNAAIDALLEGDDQGEWRESTKKKKKSPSSKTKEECESNKENRRVENRERSGSRPRGGGGPPRFRGRGGGRGGKEETSDGIGRGPGSRRGKMTNGTGPSSRGRGSRGRGSASVSSRTFQKRQPPSFTETIDTWGPPTPEKVENLANDLQIDNWDDEHSATTEDWDSEWTGTLDKSTVFGPSSSAVCNIPVANVQDATISVPNAGSALSGNLSSVGSVICPSGSSDLSPVSRATNSISGLQQQSLSESVSNVLSLGQSQQLSGSSMNSSQPYVSVTPSGSIAQSQAIDLAVLLQKAAPHSTLGRLPSQMVDSTTTLGSTSLGGENPSILSGISASVADSLKASVHVNSGVSSVSSLGSQSYTPVSSSISSSMFSNSVSDLASSLASGSGVSKVLGLSSQSSLASRSKSQSRRLPPSSSKIPASAVEMPEVAMAALDMQFTGLEFGTETFDFTSDVKPVMGNSLGPNSSLSSRDPTAAVTGSVAKELSSLNSNLSQQQSLGPQPIPFPSQGNERKPPSTSLLSGTQRASAGPTSGAASQSLADLAKKDNTSSGGHLSSLVGASTSGHSAYQSSSGVAYGSKPSFPSPPSAHYAQNPSQSLSSSASAGVSNSNYVGGTVNSSSGPSSSSSGGSQNTGYGSSFNVQGSASGGQYHQNSYVNASSHSLASISVPKTQTLTGLKDSSQSYNDTSSATSSTLSGSLSNSTTAGASNSGTGGLSSSLNSVASSSVQSVKPTVPGKTVNSLGNTIPQSVQQHVVSQSHQQNQITQQPLSQHHQSHHHLQQQQQQQQVAQQTQQTQLMAGPGPSQYVSPPAAALQGTLPPAFYNVQQPQLYSFEDLQMFQRIPHLQAPATLPSGRDAAITSPASYSVAEAAKFRTDQNSSPVPSTINQQGAAAAGTYITAAQNAAIPPFYMYQTMGPAVPSSFPQYGTPAIIQIPPNTHTGSNTSQFPGPPKLPYGGSSSTYYESISQTQDYKTGYGSGSQAQNKPGPNSSGATSNSGSDLTGYKNHISKVSRYEKQGFHSGTPPTFNLAGSVNLAGSGTNPMTANYPPMFIPTMPAAQHHSTMMHHQLHQVRSNQMDAANSAGQRTGSAGGQTKGGTKTAYSAGSYWGSN